MGPAEGGAAPPVPFDGPQSISDLFSAQVARTPDAIALEFEDTALSYRVLETRANQLAHRLQREGVGPDRRVGILLERSVEFVVSILAILKAGGAYVPLDPSYPRGRLQIMLEEAGPTVLLTQESLSDVLDVPAGCTVLSLTPDAPLYDQEPETAPRVGTTPDHLAYVLFTSGSTGRPKGVAMPHGPLLHLIKWQGRRSGLGVGDRTLQFSALSFDVSFQEIFSTWCSGGTLLLASNALRHDARALLRLLDDRAVHRLFLPFVALQHIAAVAQAEDLYPSSLREVITAGEQLKTVPSLRSFFRRRPDCSLDNQYGPTETHVVTAYRLPANTDDWATLPSIGTALPSARTYLLDEDRRPVPAGEAGELYIGGECLARGYLGRPDLTAERFLPDPFRDVTGARMYHTGDLARAHPDGTLEFLGRADHQVKVRGYRVELGEIEALLNGHEQVREAVVVAPHRGDTGHQTLVAHVVPRPGGAVDGSALRAHLQAQLPDYMVPAAFVEREAFPLTPSGKVDRKALSRLGVPSAPAARGPVAPPRTEMERRLVSLWEEALDVEPVGVTDDFFGLGGHSIMAAEMLVELSALLDRELPLSLLADTPTVEALAQKLERDDIADSWSPLVPIRPTGSQPPLFCVHGGGMNVLRFRSLAQHLDPDQPVYGLQWAGLDGRRVSDRIEDVAETYLASIRAVQPEGPYRLAGHCYGGLVAYEIAQRLRREGQTVELLVMFDAPNMMSTDVAPLSRNDASRDALSHNLSSARKLVRWVRRRLALRTRLRAWSTLFAARPVPREMQPATRRILERSVLIRYINALALLLGRRVPVAGRPNYAVSTMERAIGRYRPAPYDGELVLVHSGTDVGGYPERRFTDGMLGWASAPVGAIRHLRVEADHTGIIDHPETAEALREQLDALDPTAPHRR
ncbi:MAG: amino acid adenylation domain-containing protein [Salinivenus sp.]